MKRILSIVPIAIATLLLLVFSAIPHHHHRGVICFAMETCEKDHTYNDEHTHHNAAGDTHQGKTCSTNAEYVSSSSETIRSKVVSHDGGDNLVLLPVLCLLANYLTYSVDLLNTGITYGEFVMSYTPVVLGESSGLRAPPYCLS